jgi:hypothetical protein
VDCDFREVQDALVGLGLWPAFRPGGDRPAPKPRPAPVAPSADELRRLEHARQIWAFAQPFLAGTPAEIYLASRKIWGAIDHGTDTALRFARLQHPQTREPNIPCLIVPRHDVRTGSVVATQRIFLTSDGQKYPRKPFVTPDGFSGFADAKISLGVAPDAWSILHSQQRRAWETVERFDEQAREFFRDEVEHIETTDQLVICEGVENALSASILYERPAWARCGPFPSPEVFQHLRFPEHIRDVLIVADNDAPIKNGRPRVTSEAKALKLAEFIRSMGRRSEVVVPAVVGQDINDVLLRGAA